MPQYRLTKKCSKDCQIKVADLPQNTLSTVDDWIIDILTINQHKIMMAMHVRTLCTLLIPYDLSSTAIGVLEQIPQFFGQFLLLCGYTAREAVQAFRCLSEQPQKFCKTDNRSLLGFMNDFKKCIYYHLEDVVSEKICLNDMAVFLSELPVNIKGLGFITPRELLDEYLNQTLLLH